MTDFSKVCIDLENIIDHDRVKQNVPMQEYTYIRVGGPAAIMVEPKDDEELAAALQILDRHGIRTFTMGNGSNLIVKDGGFAGAVIRIGDLLSQVSVTEVFMEAQAGALLSIIAKAALDQSLTGFEFASGIPGSLGGAIVMNAGAYGGEMKDVVASVRVMDAKGQITTLQSQDLRYGYRSSILQQTGAIVLSAVLRLTPGNPDAIRDAMREFKQRRNEKQPVHLPSAGSVFKRPAGYYAGQLIQEAGLKGLSCGGARVSPMHCGFIVNEGGATAKDVIDLIEIVKNTVYDNSGVMLDPEVKIIGDPAS